MMNQARYAIYYAPEPQGSLWQFGSSILGYDAQLGDECPIRTPEGYSNSEWLSRTIDPRRYGFHATLKAPFRLRDGCRESGLIEQVETFGSLHQRIVVGRLEIVELDRFVALVPSAPPCALQQFVARVVTFFDAFRAPLSRDDMERRLQSPLSERQRQYLDRWGYPYVMEEFRFHMTLSGALPVGESGAARQSLDKIYREMVDEQPLILDEVALFKQTPHDGRFKVIHRAPLSVPQREEALA